LPEPLQPVAPAGKVHNHHSVECLGKIGNAVHGQPFFVIKPIDIAGWHALKTRNFTIDPPNITLKGNRGEQIPGLAG
jgi:hypothetical protein